mmetsp:Transcript_42989/g.111071  ORF Transcript_42989/g.111071 Transcript_42989/m.111071 type:complete len:303 (+) Transcript_42989:648-1556(+)
MVRVRIMSSMSGSNTTSRPPAGSLMRYGQCTTALSYFSKVKAESKAAASLMSTEELFFCSSRHRFRVGSSDSSTSVERIKLSCFKLTSTLRSSSLQTTAYTSTCADVSVKPSPASCVLAVEGEDRGRAETNDCSPPLRVDIFLTLLPALCLIVRKRVKSTSSPRFRPKTRRGFDVVRGPFGSLHCFSNRSYTPLHVFSSKREGEERGANFIRHRFSTSVFHSSSLLPLSSTAAMMCPVSDMQAQIDKTTTSVHAFALVHVQGDTHLYSPNKPAATLHRSKRCAGSQLPPSTPNLPIFSTGLC